MQWRRAEKRQRCVPSRIEVTIRYLRPLGIARLEVADNGLRHPTRSQRSVVRALLLPTKKEGTGLGLAIVAGL